MTRFSVEVSDLPGGKTMVTLDTEGGEDISFHTLMVAAEYLMFSVSRRSGAGFERSLELLCAGATTWKDQRL